MESGGQHLHAFEVDARDAEVGQQPAADPVPRRPWKCVGALALGAVVCACIFVTGPGSSFVNLDMLIRHTLGGSNTYKYNSDETGGTKDKYGCMVSAGHTYCPARAECVRPQEESCPHGTAVCQEYCANINDGGKEDDQAACSCDGAGLALDTYFDLSEEKTASPSYAEAFASCKAKVDEQLDESAPFVLQAHFERLACLAGVVVGKAKGEDVFDFCETPEENAKHLCMKAVRKRQVQGESIGNEVCDPVQIIHGLDIGSVFSSDECKGLIESAVRDVDSLSTFVNTDPDVLRMDIAQSVHRTCLEGVRHVRWLGPRYCEAFRQIAHARCLFSVRARKVDEKICDVLGDAAPGAMPLNPDGQALSELAGFRWCKSFEARLPAHVTSKWALCDQQLARLSVGADGVLSMLYGRAGAFQLVLQRGRGQDGITSVADPSSLQPRSELAACFREVAEQLDDISHGVVVAQFKYRGCVSNIPHQHPEFRSAALAACEHGRATATQLCITTVNRRRALGEIVASSTCDASAVLRRLSVTNLLASTHCQASLMSVVQQPDAMAKVMNIDVRGVHVLVAKLLQTSCSEDVAAVPGISKMHQVCSFVEAAHKTCLESVHGRESGLCDPDAATKYVQPNDLKAFTAMVQYGWCTSFFKGKGVSVCSKHLDGVRMVADDVLAMLYNYLQEPVIESKFIHWKYADACYFTEKHSRAEVLNSCAWGGKQIQIENGPCGDGPFTFEASFGMGQLPTCS